MVVNVKQSMNTSKESHISEPIENSLCRFFASFWTWPIEKSKLIFQAEGSPVFSRLTSISLRNHIQGALGEWTNPVLYHRGNVI